ncbi:MAG: trehalase-like domain-containing protein, partial [Candidatus Limnocylindrales bacterium]
MPADRDPAHLGAVPIEDYGLIGDTRTAALVAPDGSIDWMCIPRFDRHPVFARLVGGAAAGHFRLGPAARARVIERSYRPDSATLETTWETTRGRLRLTEGMVSEVSGRLLPSTLLVRRLTAEGGAVEAVVDFDPRLGEHHRRPRVDHRDDGRGDGRRALVVCSWPTIALALGATPAIAIEPGQPTIVTVTPERPLTVVLAVADREPLVYVDPDAAWAALGADETRWRAWCGDIDGGLPHRDMVVRS